jgi:hypothetical protein
MMHNINEDQFRDTWSDPNGREDPEFPHQERSTEMLLGLMAPVVAEDDAFEDTTFIPPRRRMGLRVAVVMGIVVLVGGTAAAGLYLFRSGRLSATAASGDSDEGDVRVTWCAEHPSARKGRTVRSRATKARRRSLRKRARARRHLAAAKKALRRRDWKLARREAQRALRIDRRRIVRRRASAIQRRAVRQQKVARYLIKARRALRSKQWSKAKIRAARALRLDPKNRRARSIKRLAEAKLRRQGRRRRG